MTINKIDKDLYELECDYCNNTEGYFYSFDEAVDFKKDNQWKSVKKDGEWSDKCIECVEKDVNKYNLFN